MARRTPTTNHPACRYGRWTPTQFCRAALPGRDLVVAALAPLDASRDVNRLTNIFGAKRPDRARAQGWGRGQWRRVSMNGERSHGWRQ